MKPKEENMEYERNYSHTHCWNQKTPACGQPLQNHKQCCLCDTKYSPKEEKANFVQVGDTIKCGHCYSNFAIPDLKGYVCKCKCHSPSPREIEKLWEKYALDLGMCAVGCDCGHCEKRRKVINSLRTSELQNLRREVGGLKGINRLTKDEALDKALQIIDSHIKN